MRLYEVLGTSAVPVKMRDKKAYRASASALHPTQPEPQRPNKMKEHFKGGAGGIRCHHQGRDRPQMGGYGGAHGQQSGPSHGGYQSGTLPCRTVTQSRGFGDFWSWLRPPGSFGFYGNYQQQRGPGYNGADTPEMQAARNFIVNQRYPEARRVLDGITVCNCPVVLSSPRWLIRPGNSIDALPRPAPAPPARRPDAGARQPNTR